MQVSVWWIDRRRLLDEATIKLCRVQLRINDLQEDVQPTRLVHDGAGEDPPEVRPTTAGKPHAADLERVPSSARLPSRGGELSGGPRVQATSRVIRAVVRHRQCHQEVCGSDEHLSHGSVGNPGDSAAYIVCLSGNGAAPDVRVSRMAAPPVAESVCG